MTLVFLSAALTTYYNLSTDYIGLIITGALWLVGVIALAFVQQVPYTLLNKLWKLSII